MTLALVVGIVGVLAGICVGVMVGGWVAGSAQPCRHCGEDAPYKVEPADVLIREVLGQ